MMRSESTRALGQPRLTKPIFGPGDLGGVDVIAALIEERAAAVDWRSHGPYGEARLPLRIAGNASPGDRMTVPRCERRQSLCSALAAFAFLCPSWAMFRRSRRGPGAGCRGSTEASRASQRRRELQANVKARDGEPRCGAYIIDTRNRRHPALDPLRRRGARAVRRRLPLRE
jgi:hypothetical protein